MSFTVEKLEHSMAKLTITVPAADFDKAMTAAYNKTKNRFNVPGFRKGKVPMAFIEKMYGPEVFYEDAANAMINEYYPKEAVASELEIASQPVIDVIEMGKGKDFVFTAEVAVKPEVTLGDYKGIEVEKIDVEVTDDEVLEDIKKEQLQNARKVLVEGRLLTSRDLLMVFHLMVERVRTTSSFLAHIHSSIHLRISLLVRTSERMLRLT